GTSTSTEQPELDDNIPAPPTEEEIAVMEGREQPSQPGTSTSTEQLEIDDNIPAPPTEEEIAVMEGRELQPQPGASTSTEQPALDENLSASPTEEISDFPTAEEILEFPTEDSPLILVEDDWAKLIRVPIKDGQTVHGEVSISENNCEILISGITEADASELPIIYGLEVDLFRTTSPMENHFFKYKNEEGAVLPVERVQILADEGRVAPVIHRVGQQVAFLSIGYVPTIGKVLSLGEQPDSLVRIAVPSSIMDDDLEMLPLNIFVRKDGEEQGMYKPIQYVYTDEINGDERVDVNESPQETKVVVGQKLSFSLPELSIEGRVEHIDTALGYPIVFAHVPVSPGQVESMTQQLQTSFQLRDYYVPIEWKGQLIKAPVVLRIGDKVIGGKIKIMRLVEDEYGYSTLVPEWATVTDWRPVSMNAERVKQNVRAAVGDAWAHPEQLQLGSTIELLDLLPFNLQAKSLQKLIKKQVVPQKQIEKIHTKIKDIIENTLLPKITEDKLEDKLEDTLDTIVRNHPIYDYSPYQIQNNEQYIIKQTVEVVYEVATEVVRKSIKELLQNEEFGHDLQTQIRTEMDPIIKEVSREASQYYHYKVDSNE
ncbi:hypothetical protein, partial [Paenibacillus popilliae]